MIKTEEKKKSIIGSINNKRKIDKTIDHSHSMNDDMEL